jgi:hypothetical protein
MVEVGTPGGLHERLAHVGNPVHGEADERDPRPGGTQHLQDGLLGAAERSLPGVGAVLAGDPTPADLRWAADRQKDRLLVTIA